jgi:hypothetical protein
MGAALPKNQARTSAAPVVWFVARGNLLKGPFTTDEIEERIKRRELGYFDFCWKQGFHEWRPISSVEDFERRARMNRIPAYPVVAVPGGAPSESLGLAPPPAERSAPKKVLIGFAKSRRHSITAYEWAGAMIFAVILAYFASMFALESVKSELLRRWHLAMLGRPEVHGWIAQPVDPILWSPLYSAPSFVETASITDPAHGNAPIVDLAVRVQGSPRARADGMLEVQGHRLALPGAFPVWSPRQEARPDAYGSQVQIQGRLSAKDGGLVYVTDPAYPGRWEP